MGGSTTKTMVEYGWRRKEANGDVLLAGNERHWWDLDEGKQGNGLVCQTVKERQLSGVDGR